MNRRAASPAFFWLALVALAALLGVNASPLLAESARSLFKRGQSAEARQDYDAAFTYYQQAAAKAPKDLEFRGALIRIRVTASGLHMTKGRKLFLSGDLPGALAEFLHAAEIDPGNEAAQQEIARVRTAQGEPHQPDHAVASPALLWSQTILLLQPDQGLPRGG